MDVRCPQCQTLYELDDDQVGTRSVTLKCSQCQHVFRFGGKIASGGENSRRWMVRRKVEGDVLYLTSFETLHEWILKRTVGGKDQISRTGDSWAKLGDIGEFQPMFQVVESIAQIEGDFSGQSDVSSILTRRTDTPAAAPPAVKEPTKQAPNRERIRTSIQFGGAGTPPPQLALRTEDVTKKVRPSEVMSDEEVEELEAELAGPTAPQKHELPPRHAGRPPLMTADIARERAEQPPAQAPSSSSGVGIWLFVAVIGTVAVGAYIWLYQQDDFLRKQPDVVVIGQTSSAPEVDSSAGTEQVRIALDEAVDAALSAAAQENDGIWTMWHDSASKPFYIALDTAYAEADQASVGVELHQQLKDARVALENGRLEQASRGFRQVLAKEPRNAAAVSGLGWALLELGRAQEAANQFGQSIEINPEHGDAYIGLGSAYRQLGQLQDAYNAYDLYMGRFPRGPKASIASYQMKQLRKQLGM